MVDPDEPRTTWRPTRARGPQGLLIAAQGDGGQGPGGHRPAGHADEAVPGGHPSAGRGAGRVDDAVPRRGRGGVRHRRCPHRPVGAQGVVGRGEDGRPDHRVDGPGLGPGPLRGHVPCAGARLPEEEGGRRGDRGRGGAGGAVEGRRPDGCARGQPGSGEEGLGRQGSPKSKRSSSSGTKRKSA